MAFRFSTRSVHPVKVQTENPKGDLSWMWQCRRCQVGLLWLFQKLLPPLRFIGNGQKKRQISSEWQLSGFKCLVSDVRAEWLIWVDRNAEVTHITCYYNQLRFGEEHLWKRNISDHEVDGLQCSHPLTDASSSIMNPVTKLTWSHTAFFNMTINSLYSSFLHS